LVLVGAAPCDLSTAKLLKNKKVVGGLML